MGKHFWLEDSDAHQKSCRAKNRVFSPCETVLLNKATVTIKLHHSTAAVYGIWGLCSISCMELWLPSSTTIVQGFRYHIGRPWTNTPIVSSRVCPYENWSKYILTDRKHSTTQFRHVCIFRIYILPEAVLCSCFCSCVAVCPRVSIPGLPYVLLLLFCYMSYFPISLAMAHHLSNLLMAHWSPAVVVKCH